MVMLKILNIKLPDDPAIPLLSVHPKELKGLLKEISVNDHRSVLHNSQEVEVAEVAPGRWLDKQNVLHT